MHFGGADGPGPADYEPFKPQGVVVTNLNITEEDKSRFEARIPRYHEAIEKEEEKKVWPIIDQCLRLSACMRFRISQGLASTRSAASLTPRQSK
jgi:hypothetical protein